MSGVVCSIVHIAYVELLCHTLSLSRRGDLFMMTMWQILVTVIQFQLTHACQGHFGWYNRLSIYVSLVGTYRYVLQWTRDKYVN